jgi:hypothetical protein
MSASNYLELELLDHLLGVGAYSAPTTYVALCTADPTDAGTGASMNELPDSDGYARVATAGCFGTAAASGSIANDAAVTFAAASGDWTEVTHFAILDSGTHGAGNMLLYGALTTPKTVTSGDTPRFPIGSLTITCA